MRRLALAAVTIVLFVPAAARAAAPDSLVGLWMSAAPAEQRVQGTLTMARDGSGLRAAIAGHNVRCTTRGDSTEFTLPGGLGGFRGVIRKGGDRIEGFWLQPAGGTKDTRDPGGTAQPFATPEVLTTKGVGRWQGVVRPLESPFTLALRIDRRPDGALIGAFRNHSAGSNGGASQFRVRQSGDSVWFTVRFDSAGPELRHDAIWLHDPPRLRLLWRDLGRTIDLERTTPVRAAALLPRAGKDTSYVYRMPPDVHDGWRTARARDVGMDEAALAALVQRLIRIDPFGRRAPLMHSLLVAHRGRLVLEEYFYGYDRETRHDLRSAGKTFASVMLGALMHEGVKVGPETHAYELLARMGPFANPDPRKQQITLAQLMTHTSGLDCDDNRDDSRGNEDVMQSQETQPDWWKYTLDLPVLHDPGTRYAYCSGGMNLMGAALTVATGEWLPELFERTVARPLQFGPWSWNLMPTGEGYAGGGAHLRPRDLLKVGQLYLDHGVWNGKRLIDSAWVARSTSAQVEVSPATTGLDSATFSNFYGLATDGFAWHLGKLDSGTRTYKAFMATGNGGQVLVVVPEVDLAVVFTAANYGQGGIWTRFAGEIVPKEIIPAIRD